MALYYIALDYIILHPGGRVGAGVRRAQRADGLWHEATYNYI